MAVSFPVRATWLMLTAIVALLMPGRVQAGEPPVTHVFAGSWQSTDFHDAGNPGCSLGGPASAPGSRIILGASRLQPDPMELVIRKTSWSIPAGTPVAVNLSFSDGSAMPLAGAGNGQAIQISLSGETLRQFVHALTTNSLMQLQFGGTEPVWSFDLRGASQVVNAMAACFQSHHIAGLPPLFGGVAAPAETAPAEAFLDPALLSPIEIVRIQDALIWTGHYLGLKNGEWSRATVAAIRSWRQANELPSAVSLRPTERDMLLAQAASLKSGLGWRNFVDPASGAAIGVPTRLVTAQSLADGTSYSGNRGVDFVVRRYGIGLDAIQGALSAQAATPNVQRVTYRLNKPDRQVLSFETRDGANVYIRLDRTGAGWTGFQATIGRDVGSATAMITAFSADFSAAGNLPADAVEAAPLVAAAPPALPVPAATPPPAPSPPPPSLSAPEPVSSAPQPGLRLPAAPDSGLGLYLPVVIGVAAGALVLFFRNLVLVAALLVGGVVGYPLLNEQTGSVCHALEKRGVAMVLAASPKDAANPLVSMLAGAFASNVLDGSLAAGLVKQKYPTLPPVIGCTAAYWGTFLDPSVAQSLAAAVKER